MLITNTKPDIITLEETNVDFSLPGYERYVKPSIIPNGKGTQLLSTPPTMAITYVNKTLPTIQLDTTHLNTSEKEHVATTAMGDGHNITIVKSYWAPKQTTAALPAFHTLYNATRSSKTLRLLGGFNSPHPNWGYTRTSPLGRKLGEFTSVHHFTLMNDTTAPTRLGSHQEADTNPDLTWNRGLLNAAWDNTEETFGSDHNIIQISVSLTRS